jgi:N-acetylglucosamine-6-phosphate deacetylase
MSDSLRVCRGAGVPLEEALRAATSTPARVIGRSDVGSIHVGARADLVSLNDDLDVVGVWLAGTRLR